MKPCLCTTFAYSTTCNPSYPSVLFHLSYVFTLLINKEWIQFFVTIQWQFHHWGRKMTGWIECIITPSVKAFLMMWLVEVNFYWTIPGSCTHSHATKKPHRQNDSLEEVFYRYRVPTGLNFFLPHDKEQIRGWQVYIVSMNLPYHMTTFITYM